VLSSITPTLRFSFISEGERDVLLSRLTEGQTLQARVVEDLSDGRWALRFLGHTLVAESRLNLAKGQIVEARVQELGPPLVLSIAGRAGSESEAVGDALKRLGLPVDESHREILASLVREALPINRESVLELVTVMQQLDTESLGLDLNELIERILLLRSKGVPVTPDALAAFFGSVSPAALGGVIEQVGDLLKAHARRIRNETALHLAFERIRSAVPNADNLDGKAVKAWIARLGFDLEHRLGNGTIDRLPEGNALRGLLGQLHEETDGADFLEHAIRMMDTLRLGALPGREGEDLRLQIPLVFGKEQTTIDLHLSREGNDADPTVDDRHYSMTLRVTLSELGEVHVTLTRHGDHTTCHVATADTHTAEWLRQASDELVDRLRTSGLNVGQISVRSVPTKQEEPARVGIDLKV